MLDGKPSAYTSGAKDFDVIGPDGRYRKCLHAKPKQCRFPIVRKYPTTQVWLSGEEQG